MESTPSRESVPTGISRHPRAEPGYRSQQSDFSTQRGLEQMSRILIDIQNIKSVAGGDTDLESEMQRALAELADELNSALPGYEVMLVHYDTDDLLSFTSRDIDTDDDNYSRDMAERKQIADDLLGEDDGD